MLNAFALYLKKKEKKRDRILPLIFEKAKLRFPELW